MYGITISYEEAGERTDPFSSAFRLSDVEKAYLLSLILGLSTVYFTDVLGFCLMGNHFHLLVRMLPETGIQGRCNLFNLFPSTARIFVLMRDFELRWSPPRPSPFRLK